MFPPPPPGRNLPFKKGGVLTEILKRTYEVQRSCLVGVALTPKKYQFLNRHIIIRHILRLNTLRGTARPLTVDITRLNTLLNPK